MTAAPPADILRDRAAELSGFLRILANGDRLAILCHLAAAERSVAQLQDDLSIRQPMLSRHLGELRSAGLVDTRRQSRTVFYTLSDIRTRRLLGAIAAALDGAPQPVPPSGADPSPRHVDEAARFAKLLTRATAPSAS
jgi:DNA-binding transcriptional ArsR family regulator